MKKVGKVGKWGKWGKFEKLVKFENLLGRFGAPYFLEPKHVSSLNCTTVYDNMRIGLHCLITRTATIQCGSRSLDQGLTNLELIWFLLLL